jgi:hypothetical protein
VSLLLPVLFGDLILLFIHCLVTRLAPMVALFCFC